MKRNILFVFVFAACGSSVKPQLTSITPATAAACPAGGSTIVIASDKNGNGKIDPGEATTTQNVCNPPIPPPVPQSLATSIVVPAGAQGCSLGGVEIDTGVDNGSGGGTANNGVLEAGEVTNKQVVCGTPGIVRQGDLAGPAKPAGAFTISSKGGDADIVSGTTFNGGAAGTLNITGSGTLGGSTAIFKTGVAVAKFTAPALKPNYGSGVQADFADTTTPTSITAGEVEGYFLENSSNQRLLFKSGTTVSEVTGIHIEAGVTVDFPAGADFKVDNDILNEGTITSELALTIGCANYVGGDASAITMVSGVTTPGLSIGTSGAFINGLGSISAGGAAGIAGGSISITTLGKFYNVGPITADGGTKAGTASLNGGPITINGTLGWYNSGAISANAGDSSPGAVGGVGGVIALSSTNGELVNAGPISSNGGQGSQGGNGTSISLIAGAPINVFTIAAGGDIISSGDLSAVGGAAHGTSTPGGLGGTITITGNSSGQLNAGGQAMGSVTVSGNLKTDGGSSDTGAGGDGLPFQPPLASPVPSIVISNNIGGNFDGQQILLLGYTNVVLTGGKGQEGGQGGKLALLATRTSGDVTFNDTGFSVPDGFSGPAGAAINEADIDISAGDSTSDPKLAADAGAVGVVSGVSPSLPLELPSENANGLAINRGNVAGTSLSASGGRVVIEGHDGAENDGTLTLNIGDNVDAAVIIQCSAGTAVNTGAIDVSSTDEGAVGGSISISGPQVKNSQDLTANGATGVAQDGGDGGLITLSSSSGTTSNTGHLTADGGAGDVGFYSGLHGVVSIDGVTQ